MQASWAQRRFFATNMEQLLNYLLWLVAGGMLILLEFFLPGLFVVFLGLGAVATGGLIYLQVIRDGYQAIIFFVLVSIFLLATLRRLIRRFFLPESESVETDEDALILGAEARTISEISPSDFSGRVKFRGTTWPARSVYTAIPEGERVVIAGRENINLLVKRA